MTSAAPAKSLTAWDRLLAHSDVVEHPKGEGTAKAWCPFHNDKRPGGKPSLTIDPTKHRIWCQSSCGRRIKLADLAREWGIAQGGNRSASDGPVPSLTLEQYCEAKRLPVELLQAEGLRTAPYVGGKALRIPYLDPSGNETAVRFRLSMKDEPGLSRFKWKTGSKPSLYGLHRLHQAEAMGYAILVEGESSAQTLWHRERPALGFPGATSFKAEWAQHLVKIPRLILIKDPDEAGDRCIERMAAMPFRDKVRWAELKGYSDPSELHIQAPDRFDEVLQAAIDAAQPLPERELKDDCPYKAAPNGLWLTRSTRDGPVDQRLANFTARITAGVIEDDGAEVRQSFAIEAEMKGQRRSFTIPATNFMAMGWPVEHLGPEAIVFAGLGTKDHARVAIQMLSDDVSGRHIYKHIGWREIDGQWLYLHAGGAIGKDGPAEGLEVHLDGSLARYELPAPPMGQHLKEAIRASLEVPKTLQAKTSVPPYLATFRSVLGGSDFSVILVGQTGSGKSEYASLCQRHFGAGMERLNLPANWSSTANALEDLAFMAADTILTIDEFVPGRSRGSSDELHNKAARLISAQGNNSGRGRMNRDRTQQQQRPPRGTILITGEDVPRGQSVQARAMVCDFPNKDANGGMLWDQLGQRQQEAKAGRYAEAMSAYIQWIAARHTEIQTAKLEFHEKLREAAYTEGQHRRTPDIIANLALGGLFFLRFAAEAGAVSKAEAEGIFTAWWTALGETAAEQDSHQAAYDPAIRYPELIHAALQSGRAHIANLSGHPPGDPDDPGDPLDPAAWGWRLQKIGAGNYQRTEWQPQGERIGWIDDDGLYLQPDAAYATAQKMAADQDGSLTVQPNTLNKRLHEKGLLASIDEKRGKLLIRKTINGQRLKVLHLRMGSTPSTNGAHGAHGAHPSHPQVEIGPLLWAPFATANGKGAHKKGPNQEHPELEVDGGGPRGPIGPLSEAQESPMRTTTAPMRNGVVQ